MIKIEFKDFGERKNWISGKLEDSSSGKKYLLYHPIMIKKLLQYLIQTLMTLILQSKLQNQFFQIGKEQIFVIVQKLCFVLKRSWNRILMN